MTNHNKHQREILKFLYSKFFSHSNKIITFFLPMVLKSNLDGAGFALKAWSKNEPLKKFKGLITSPSIKETRNDGSSMDDIIPYLHHRSAVRFSSY
jgi:hypothetical protein